VRHNYPRDVYYGKDKPMLLAADIGNTNIHLGLYEGGSWVNTWRAQTVPDKMPDEYAMLIRAWLHTAGINSDAISGVIIGSVVPRLTRAFRILSQRYFDIDPIVVTHETYTGFKIDIDHPDQAGADRIVNTAAVNALYGGPAIVIDLGTATTFDIVSADGAYRGGAIAPGIGIAHDALVSRAARLHNIDIAPPPSPIGSNTIHAMQSGIFWGYIGLIEGLVTRLKAAINEPGVKVIVTGGLAPLVTEHTDVVDIVAPELTLDGLRVIYDLNRKSDNGTQPGK
jgi:type III pantothenate kinase